MRNWYPGLPTAAHGSDTSGTGRRRRWRFWRRGKRSDGDGSLEQTIAELNSRQKDMAFLGDMAQLFQACRTLEEVGRVARDRLQSLSPGLSGALYLMNETREHLESVMAWGTVEPTGVFFAPGDCWALRCGRPHQAHRGDDAMACVHTDAEQGDWHLCVPLMAQGEGLGVLYFRIDAKGRRRGGGQTVIGDERLRFYSNVAETLSLAIANVRLRETLQHQAVRDPLTGLFNRRYFQETLRRELHRASRDGQPLSLVIIDIDHFKHFNDTWGHDAGDAALKAVGEILMGRTRAGDVACRLGGEEFALAFPGLSAEVATSRVEALREEIQAREIHFLGQVIDPVTISAGVAVYPGHGMDTDSLLRAADQALFRAKRAGRNRLAMAGQPQLVASASPPPLSLVHNVARPGGGDNTRRAVAE
jgi:diguanylate cyclase (GGDEF)-like protein